MKTREEDFVERLFIASTHAYMLIFTNAGRVYWLKVYEVPDVGAAGKGKHIGNLVALQPGESVRAIAAGARPGRRSKLHLLRHAQRDGQEDAAEGLLQRDVARHHRHRHRQGRRTGGGGGDQRLPDHLPGVARGHGDPLRRRRRARPWDAGVRRPRHGHGQGRLHCRHGGDAKERGAGERRQEKRQGQSRKPNRRRT